MINKKILVLCLAFLVGSILVVGCSGPPKAVTINDLDMANAFVVGENFAAVYTFPDTDENYFGPYGTAYSITAEAGALMFDCSVTTGWCTLDFPAIEDSSTSYKYAVVAMKIDSAANASDALLSHLTFGNAAKSLSSWGITSLSTTYKVYVLDLTANGFTKWKAPYFAMNQSEASTAKIYFDYIKLANKK